MAENPSDNTPSPLQRAVAAVGAVRKLAAARDRSDFVTRLDTARDRLQNLSYRVLVVGEYKKGKSTLINSLVNAEVCPTDDDIATARPVAVYYSEEPRAEVELDAQAEAPDAAPPGLADQPRTHVIDARWSDDREDDEGADGNGPAVGGGGKTELVPVDLNQIAQWATDRTPPVDRPIRSVRIGLPRALLSGGLVLVDTPGVGGLRSAYGAATIRMVESADGVLFVSDAAQEYTRSELDYLHAVRQLCPNVACVMTKIDFYPSWRRMVDNNRAHLQRAGIESSILATSAPLRRAAIEASDRELNAESGYADVVNVLRSGLGARAQALAVERVVSELDEVLRQVEGQIEAELGVLEDPARAEATMATLEEAKARAEELKSRASKWNQTLNDGTTDLVADIEHHLRAQFRELTRQADEAIESSDPGKTWDEFEPWLVNAVSSLLTNHYTYQAQRSRHLAAQVAQHFGDDADLASDLLPTSGELELSETVAAKFESRKFGIGARSLTAVRSGYGGVAMAGLAAGIAGIGLVAALPIGLGMGVVLGRKAIRDEGKRMLAQRRQAAKQAVHRYTDEALFRASKDARDTLRFTQRQLRDFYAARAEELTRSTQESLLAVQKSLKADLETQKQRKAELAEQRKLATAARRQLEAAAAEIAGGRGAAEAGPAGAAAATGPASGVGR